MLLLRQCGSSHNSPGRSVLNIQLSVAVVGMIIQESNPNIKTCGLMHFRCGNRVLLLLLLRRRTLHGDACCPHEGGCPPQPLQVAIQLVPQKRRIWRPKIRGELLYLEQKGKNCTHELVVFLISLHIHVLVCGHRHTDACLHTSTYARCLFKRMSLFFYDKIRKLETKSISSSLLLSSQFTNSL